MGEVCDEGDWLIELDNFNLCPATGCTNVGVYPIIAKLTEIDDDDDQLSYFLIDPESTVTPEQQSLLNTLQVRVTDTGQAEVIRRSEIR